MNSILTIVPKTFRPSQHKPRSTHNSAGAITIISLGGYSDNEINVQPKQKLTMKVQQLQKEIEKLKLDFEERKGQLKERVTQLEEMLKESKFSIDRFKYNQAHFKFYVCN